MPEVCLTFDPGSSLTKCVYLCSAQAVPATLLMPPETVEVSESLLRTQLHSSIELDIDLDQPVLSAWLKLKRSHDQVYAVGALAQRFTQQLRLDKLKYESSLYKVLAAVGVIAQAHSLPGAFSLALSMVLPFGEYRNAQRLERQLKSALSNFYFRGRRYLVNLQVFRCLPEGMGLVLHELASPGPISTHSRIAALMAGHRNSSLLVFDQGRIQQGQTTDLGFYQLIDEAVANTAGQTAQRLTPVVYAIGENITVDDDRIWGLCRSTDPDNRWVEVNQLVEAIQAARRLYWLRMQEWLGEALPEHYDAVLVSGGAGLYLKPELASFLPGRLTYWGLGLRQKVVEAFNFNPQGLEPVANALDYRLMDAYGVFLRYGAPLGACKEIA